MADTERDAAQDEAQEELDEWIGDSITDPTDDAIDARTRRHQFANILLYRKGRAQRKLTRYRQVVDAEKKRAEAFWEQVSPRWERRIAEADATLRSIMEDEHRDDPRAKTVRLPNGTLTWREAPVAALVVDDEEAAVAWLKGRGIKATRQTEVVAKDELKKVAQPAPRAPAEGAEPGRYWFNVTVDGEIVPGCHLERQAAPTIKANPA